MSLTFGFYNSVDGDRTYDAIQMSQIFDGIITDGVYATFMKGMVVKASENASEVIVQPGRCWFNHTWTYIDAEYPVEAPDPEVILDRVDALVLDINSENAWRENKLTWVQGEPSSLNPARPTLTNTVTHHQYALAYIYRKAGTTMIYTADITNVIGTSETPFVTGVLEGLDIDAWLAQWDDEFHTWENTTKTQFEGWMVNQQAVYTTWFDAIKDQMEGDLDDFEAWFETIRGIIDSEAATHLQAEIDELAAMLPAGSHIDITTTESTLYNRNVTVTDGFHPKIVQFDATGHATVESYPYIGMLSVTSTDGERIATESITVPYFGRYNTTLAFWSATINFVGDSAAAAGIVISVYDSESVIPLTSITLDSQGQGSYTATYPDTYKFRYTYGGQTMEVSLAVTQETTYTISIHAGFDYQAWLTEGRVSGTYASLDAILADEAALRQLMLVHDSVDYLAVANVTPDVEKIFNCDLAAKWINLSDYALDTFYAVPAIKTVMDTADKYGYGEWTIVAPRVTSASSATTEEGTIECTGTPNADVWNIFGSSIYPNDYTSPLVITYTLNDPTKVSHITYNWASTSAGGIISNVKMEVHSNSDWVTVRDRRFDTSGYNNFDDDVPVNSIIDAVRITLTTVANYAGAIGLLRVYDVWGPKGNVPVMTSNTAPYGTTVKNGEYNTTQQAWRAFDGDDTTYWMDDMSGSLSGHYIGYTFCNPICVKRLYLKTNPLYPTVNIYEVDGSNDGGNTWEPIDTSTHVLTNNQITLNIANGGYYLSYRVMLTSGQGAGGEWEASAMALQFYGREMSVSVPAMATNTTPYGVASADSEYGSSYGAYAAFAPNAMWEGQNNGRTDGLGHWIQYKFQNPMVLKHVYLYDNQTGHYATTNIVELKASNTGESNDWTVLASNLAVDSNGVINHDLPSNVTPYKYYRCDLKNKIRNSNNYGTVGELQFYGFDYSEKEFEQGTTKKWLYDHGVELEVPTLRKGSYTQSAPIKNDDCLYISTAPTSGHSVNDVYTYSSCLYQEDLTNYSVIRGVVKNKYNGGANTRFYVFSSDAARPTTGAYVNTYDVSYVAIGNLPNNCSHNISSASGTNWVCAEALYTANLNFELYELWLE